MPPERELLQNDVGQLVAHKDAQLMDLRADCHSFSSKAVQLHYPNCCFYYTVKSLLLAVPGYRIPPIKSHQEVSGVATIDK